MSNAAILVQAVAQAILQIAIVATVQACTLTRTLIHNFADLDDHRIFANREVLNAAEESPLRSLRHEPAFVNALRVPDDTGATWPLDAYLERTRTAAFIVLHEDHIVLERYARGFDQQSLLNSFSIAKSFMGVLVGIAIEEGRLAGLDISVASICQEFEGTAYGPVTLRQLLTMTSGVTDAPSLLPGRAEYYYGSDLHAQAMHARPATSDSPPWHYSEADLQVAGFVLERAVGMPVSAYLASRLWQPLGMEAPALWALDREGGEEKTFCCISARARDFARFGKLIRDGGRWNGRKLIPAAWAERKVLPGFEDGTGYVHQHLWWTPEGGRGDFFAYGHNGQYVYVNPSARLVIVKFSETH